MPNLRTAKKRRKPKRRAILLAGPEGEVRYADAPAKRWLREFFGRPERAKLLQRKVRRWLQDFAHRRSPALTGKKGTTHLYVRRQNSLTEDSTVLLLELIKSKGEERQRRHRNLTPREREVLFWITRGKSNAEIATILAIASATVGKHLERIYAKLGVENRTAACSLTLEKQTRL